jgi:hypothetical protein
MVTLETKTMSIQKTDPTCEEFKRWFGTSVVVNTLGHPLVVYHGTTARFQQFSKSEDDGFHFGDRAAAGWRLADLTGDEATYGNRILAVYLSIQRPKLLDFDAGDAVSWHQEIEQAKAQGFDGIRYPNSEEVDEDLETGERPETFSWIAFEQEQIKIVKNESASVLLKKEHCRSTKLAPRQTANAAAPVGPRVAKRALRSTKLAPPRTADAAAPVGPRVAKRALRSTKLAPPRTADAAAPVGPRVAKRALRSTKLAPRQTADAAAPVGPRVAAAGEPTRRASGTRSPSASSPPPRPWLTGQLVIPGFARAPADWLHQCQSAFMLPQRSRS